MTGTTGNTSTEVPPLSRVQRRLKRQQHKLAQRRYREKNKEALRAKARTQMQMYDDYRARIQMSAELKALAGDSRREADASYRERCGQKKIIARFGEGSFDDIYLPQFAIHGNNTHKLQFVREPEKAAEARLAKEARRAKDRKDRNR
ncbi:hypothetical protein C8F04DRAFT_1270117 [Mycena alexandri]|uniref:Uncharacterized protein n=1 Tax=Mycena alexandri TaxID=1745969 RepID=A0AAD6WTB5_9AGAR|nr:hypothetical protein C8F04DRAFT_1270117 [Mycena alexandri]